jgi:hypothetical protein
MCECDLKGAGPCGGKLYRWEDLNFYRCGDHISLQYYWSQGCNGLNHRISLWEWLSSLDTGTRQDILSSAPPIPTTFWREVTV